MLRTTLRTIVMGMILLACYFILNIVFSFDGINLWFAIILGIPVIWILVRIWIKLGDIDD